MSGARCSISAETLPLPGGAATEATLAAILARPTTATRTSVNAAAQDTALMAANASRRGATVYNDGSTDLYLALGAAAASVTSFTCKVAPGGYYEAPYAYAGAVRGIWAGSPTGAARMTEVV